MNFFSQKYFNLYITINKIYNYYYCEIYMIFKIVKHKVYSMYVCVCFGHVSIFLFIVCLYYTACCGHSDILKITPPRQAK